MQLNQLYYILRQIPYIYKIPSSTHVIYTNSPWLYHTSGWKHHSKSISTNTLPNTTYHYVIRMDYNQSLTIPLFRKPFSPHYHFVNLIEKKCTCRLPSCIHITHAITIRYHYLSILFLRYIHHTYLFRLPLHYLEQFLLTKPIMFTTPLTPP